MNESTIENIHYKFELKKLIGDETISADVNKTKIRSDPWIDDLDMLTSTPNFEPLEDKTDKDISYSALYGNDNEEAKLIEEYVDLYNDLVKIEEEEMKAKQMHDIEFENCKKELKKFQELDMKNKVKIEELTKENTNLKRSISSLYRTFKREIEFKDYELSDANNEITRLTYRLNGQTLKNGKCSFSENINNDSKKDYNTSKRKRSESPEQLSNKKEQKSSISKTYEKDLQSEKDKRTHRSNHGITDNKRSSHLENKADKKDNLHKQILKGSCKRTESARKYENDENNKSEIKKDTAQKDFSKVPKNRYNSKQIKRGESVSNKRSENISSSSRNEAVPSSSSEHSQVTGSDRRFKKDLLDKYKFKRDRPQRRDSKISKNYCARQTKKDVISLFSYRKQKIPFDVKKRFDLHKDDQKMIPKHLL